MPLKKRNGMMYTIPSKTKFYAFHIKGCFT